MARRSAEPEPAEPEPAHPSAQAHAALAPNEIIGPPPAAPTDGRPAVGPGDFGRPDRARWAHWPEPEQGGRAARHGRVAGARRCPGAWCVLQEEAGARWLACG
jgi:hypothetical protein